MGGISLGGKIIPYIIEKINNFEEERNILFL